MLNKKAETGRSLVETLAVLVVIAILLLASLAGYNFTIHKYKKDQTVKAISELAVRYKLHPISKKGPMEIKSIYPEAERADAVNMRTADTDTGRVRLEVSEDTSYFAVVVNNILDDSCREYLEKGEYDAALLLNGAKYDSNSDKEYLAFGKDFLKDFDFGKLTTEQQGKLKKLTKENTSKEAVINVICAGVPQAKTAAFVIGDKCPKQGASHYYNGKCWPCPEDETEDRYGVCCSAEQINSKEWCYSCGCPNGTHCDGTGPGATGQCVECTEHSHCSGRSDGKIKCDTTAHKCVECVTPGERCEGEPERYCMKNHTCQECDTTKYLFWNRDLDICECKKPLIALNETCVDGCCADGLICHGGACMGCWADYDPADPDKEGSCKAERPLCKDGLCQGCPTTPAVQDEVCYALCGCDATKGLTCQEGTCKCTDPSKPYWNGSACVECVSNDDCPAAEFCKTTDGSYTCKPCSTSTNAGVVYLVHAPNTTDRCDCTNDLRQCCNSNCTQYYTAMDCVPGGSLLTCVPGCTQHPDCDENYYCSCLGTKCPAAGGECLPCPSDKPLRPKDSAQDCQPGQLCNCDLKDSECPASCCKGCDYKNDPEHCPVSKCCNPAEDPETCPDTPEDPCIKNPNSPSCKCGECEEYVPYKGCVSKCADDEACVTYNKGTNTCGESQCLKVLPKDKLIRKKGTLNNRMFYIPPAESKYRMTHASADRFCAHYGMHLARVMEACLKDFKYDSGHDCPNFAAHGGEARFTDRGQTYDLASWNTSSSGDFWLAERDGNNALRVTHSCGNNHETNVCANIYPLCTE